MKITKIETISLAELPNVVWIQVHTDAGHVGLGETFFGSQAIHAYVHETLAPQVLGQDALRIEQHSRKLMQNYVGFKSTGVEIRGASAFDIALWDIMGQAAGMPLYQLLGGASREHMLCYTHADGTDIAHALEAVEAKRQRGFRAIRVQAGVPGLNRIYGVHAPGESHDAPQDAPLMERLEEVHEQRQRQLAPLGDLPGRHNVIRVLSQIPQANQGIVGFLTELEHLWGNIGLQGCGFKPLRPYLS